MSRTCASPISAWWWPRWKRAAPPASTTRQATATRCMPVRRAPTRMRGQVASIMGVPNDKLRVITEDVGGAFGMKTTAYPEYIGGAGGRAQSSAGRCTGSRRARKPSSPTARRATPSPMPSLRSTTRASSWPCACAICAIRAPTSPTPASTSTPTISRAACPACTGSRRSTLAVACYFSNKVPIAPYRGAGRPEANYALERAVEEAARMLKMDPVRLRKKNLIPASAMPFKTPINTYDCGDFPGIVDKALQACRLRQLQQAQARSGQAQEAARHRRVLHAGACRRDADGNARRSAFPAATS